MQRHEINNEEHDRKAAQAYEAGNERFIHELRSFMGMLKAAEEDKNLDHTDVFRLIDEAAKLLTGHRTDIHVQCTQEIIRNLSEAGRSHRVAWVRRGLTTTYVGANRFLVYMEGEK